jgi:hypothetical protein
VAYNVLIEKCELGRLWDEAIVVYFSVTQEGRKEGRRAITTSE